MKRIDRLTIQIQKAYGANEQVGFAMVIPTEGGKWQAITDLCNGTEGSTDTDSRITSTHDTIEEAVKSIEAIAEAHSPVGQYRLVYNDPPIIICDI